MNFILNSRIVVDAVNESIFIMLDICYLFVTQFDVTCERKKLHRSEDLNLLLNRNQLNPFQIVDQLKYSFRIDRDTVAQLLCHLLRKREKKHRRKSTTENIK